MESLRQQLTTAQTSARESLAAAETAQAKLGASEASWKQQKEALEKEIGDLKDRCVAFPVRRNARSTMWRQDQGPCRAE